MILLVGCKLYADERLWVEQQFTSDEDRRIASLVAYDETMTKWCFAKPSPTHSNPKPNPNPNPNPDPDPDSDPDPDPDPDPNPDPNPYPNPNPKP